MAVSDVVTFGDTRHVLSSGCIYITANVSSPNGLLVAILVDSSFHSSWRLWRRMCSCCLTSQHRDDLETPTGWANTAPDTGCSRDTQYHLEIQNYFALRMVVVRHGMVIALSCFQPPHSFGCIILLSKLALRKHLRFCSLYIGWLLPGSISYSMTHSVGINT